MNDPYYERTAVLIKLGHQTYRSYLDSTLWKTIRAAVLRAYPACLRCGKPATQVHHGSYDEQTMRGLRVDTLITACGRCHREAEKASYGLTGWERLNAVTVFLMLRLRRSSKRQRRRDKAAITWTPDSPIKVELEPAKRAKKIREWTKRIIDQRPAFNATPRLRKT